MASLHFVKVQDVGDIHVEDGRDLFQEQVKMEKIFVSKTSPVHKVSLPW